MSSARSGISVPNRLRIDPWLLGDVHLARELKRSAKKLSLVFGFDGVITFDLALQEATWKGAAARFLRDYAPGRAGLGDAVSEIISDAFANWNFQGIWERLWEVVRRIVPPEITSPSDLNKVWTSDRSHFIIMLAQRGEISPAPGIAQLLSQCSRRGVKVGLCANNCKSQVESLLRIFLPEDDETLIPKASRVFRSSMPRKRAGDPAAEEYRLLANRMGVTVRDLVVVDSHLGTLQHARALGVAAAVLVYGDLPSQEFHAARQQVDEFESPLFMVVRPEHIHL